MAAAKTSEDKADVPVTTEDKTDVPVTTTTTATPSRFDATPSRFGAQGGFYLGEGGIGGDRGWNAAEAKDGRDEKGNPDGFKMFQQWDGLLDGFLAAGAGKAVITEVWAEFMSKNIVKYAPAPPTVKSPLFGTFRGAGEYIGKHVVALGAYDGLAQLLAKGPGRDGVEVTTYGDVLFSSFPPFTFTNLNTKAKAFFPKGTFSEYIRYNKDRTKAEEVLLVCQNPQAFDEMEAGRNWNIQE